MCCTIMKPNLKQKYMFLFFLPTRWGEKNEIVGYESINEHKKGVIINDSARF